MIPSIFTSDKAPYVIALVVSILAWHVSQLAEDIRSTRAVSYSVTVDEKTSVLTAVIKNVSKTKSLVGAEFALACPKAKKCLAQRQRQRQRQQQKPPPHGPAPSFGFVRVSPPNAPAATAFVVNDDRELTLRTTLAAGGEIAFGGELLDTKQVPVFFFKPDPDKPLDIYIYAAKSPMGFVVENYFGIVLASFITFLVLLILLIFGPPTGRLAQLLVRGIHWLRTKL